jgi:hypothetical protein
VSRGLYQGPTGELRTPVRLRSELRTLTDFIEAFEPVVTCHQVRFAEAPFPTVGATLRQPAFSNRFGQPTAQQHVSPNPEKPTTVCLCGRNTMKLLVLHYFSDENATSQPGLFPSLLPLPALICELHLTTQYSPIR